MPLMRTPNGLDRLVPELDEDEVSLVESVRLHMCSEHDFDDALTMPESELEELHRLAHEDEDQPLDHTVDEHYFRAGVCLTRTVAAIPAPRDAVS